MTGRGKDLNMSHKSRSEVNMAVMKALLHVAKEVCELCRFDLVIHKDSLGVYNHYSLGKFCDVCKAQATRLEMENYK